MALPIFNIRVEPSADGYNVVYEQQSAWLAMATVEVLEATYTKREHADRHMRALKSIEALRKHQKEPSHA